jgi:hypothetical protein
MIASDCMRVHASAHHGAIERVRQANADGRQCEELAFVAEGQVRRAAVGGRCGHAQHGEGHGDAATSELHLNIYT